MTSFFVQNFGCRATQADGAAIEKQFHQQGFIRAESSASANLVVINSCTVTASADQEARAAIRRVHNTNPACEIVVTGCYAQRVPEEVAALPGVSRVIGNSHKHRLAELAATLRSSSEFIPLSRLCPDSSATGAGIQIFVSDIFAHTELLAAPVFAGHGHTRPILKVQDGCDNRCSFCVIPSVRGHSRSLPLAEILSQVDGLVKEGYREVVISGINLGRWGRDLTHDKHSSSAKFEDLIRAILAKTSLEKLRISSVEPMDWSDELIGLMADSPRIAKHAHVPLQSGSDHVLRMMHRKYRPWHYREKIEKIRAAMPTAAIGADVMVGFPGESEFDFDTTRRMIEELPFTYLHVFTYSSRPGTASASMPDQVPVQLARERNQILRDLGAKKQIAFMKTFITNVLETITLNTIHQMPNGEYTEALTDNYLKLRLRGRYEPNQKIMAHIEGVKDGALLGSTAFETRRHGCLLQDESIPSSVLS
ncbi:MAG TPA: tRNA (N(6)-L-threonylcarbamoyladenosine(37)-C(2))-methylthiotransferase MtaB [Terriglobales bacterium]|nr:tRNA (N(6)-L-threonylcarbamoyladenosine(37)-C(2))-methylthiotransferase MtaB [Terriglobales bacterium]